MKKKTTDGVTRLLDIGSGFVSVCAGLLAMLLILYSGYVLYDNMATEVSAFSSNSDLLKYKPSAMAQAPDKRSLADINPDYRGWITVDGTPIDYPVVQGEDDLYYASHDANRENSLTGAIYLAAGNSPGFTDSYNLLYGHHMDSGAMFGSLDKFRDREWFSAHQKGTVIALDGKVWDVTFFAVANTDAYEMQIYKVGNRAAEVKAFLTGSRADDTGIGTEVLIYEKSIAAEADRILALSTCASADTNGRLVVFGRMTVRKEADPTETPTDKPTGKPTETPTDKPTGKPTDKPTDKPTNTLTPTPTPTATRGGSTGKVTPSPTPTATPETETVKLTVKYIGSNGAVFPEQVFIHMPGERYYVVSPQLPGYDMDREIIQGVIKNDMVVVVNYTPKTYRLSVRYVFPDGTEASKTYETDVHTGEAYHVYSPKIEGYRASRLKISGVNAGRNEQYTVIYLPDDGKEYASIDDYDTPLNPGYNDLQIGVCFE